MTDVTGPLEVGKGPLEGNTAACLDTRWAVGGHTAQGGWGENASFKRAEAGVSGRRCLHPPCQSVGTSWVGSDGEGKHFLLCLLSTFRSYEPSVRSGYQIGPNFVPICVTLIMFSVSNLLYLLHF